MKTRSVRTRLAAIQNWPELAAQADYRVEKLAKDCNAGRETLRIFFAERFKKTIKRWLREQRVIEVQAKLRTGECLKNIVGALGYHDLAHLTHDFENVCKLGPGKWAKLFAAKNSNNQTKKKEFKVNGQIYNLR